MLAGWMGRYIIGKGETAGFRDNVFLNLLRKMGGRDYWKEGAYMGEDRVNVA